MKLLSYVLCATFLIVALPLSAQISYTNSNEEDSPLMAAVKANNLATVKKLVAAGTDVNEYTDNGWYDAPVDVAVRNNYQAVALYLLEQGATSRKYFYAAVEKGNLEYIKRLVDYGYGDDEAVLAAVEANNTALVEYFIGLGYPVDFEQKRRTGLFRKEYISPLDAALDTRNVTVIVALVKAGAPIEQAFRASCRMVDQQLGTKLLAMKVDLDQLHLIAVEENNLVFARKALQLGANPTAVNQDGKNALHIAAESGFQSLMDYATKECGILLTSNTSAGQNCLMLAAASKNYNLFAELIKDPTFPIEHADKQGETVLFYAIGSNNPEILNLCLTKNPNRNHRNNDGETPAMKAMEIRYMGQYQILTASGIDYTLKSNKGVDLLGYYMLYGSASLAEIEQLVKLGCDPNGRDPNGANMAYHAVVTGNMDLLNKMKEWKVAIDPMTDSGKRPSSGMSSQIIQFVVANGGNPDRLSTDDESYLQEAIRKQDIQLFAFLLRSGANPNAKTRWNEPLLFSVLSSERIDYLKLLLEYKADVNVQDTWGKNALEKAIEDNSATTVAVLRGAGAKTKQEWAELELQRTKEMQGLPNLINTGNLAAVLNLLNKYPDIRLTKDQINTLIRPAIQQENTALIERLFAQGLLPTATVNFEQQNLAHIAAIEGKLNLLKLFVNKGADSQALDAYDKRPIDYAKDKEIKTYLKELGKKK